MINLEHNYSIVEKLNKQELININGGSEASRRAGEEWGRSFTRALKKATTVIGVWMLFL